MFSRAYDDEIRQHFDHQMNLLKNRVEELRKEELKQAEEDRNLCRFSRMLLERKLEEITALFSQCTQDEAQALRFLYSAMPLSDLLNYPASVYLEYARHGVFLWREGPFAGRVPEELFANYVLHYRVHNEDITDTRKFFYDQLKERTAHRNMYDAAVETNYWCAEKATYQSTFMRTQNPVTMYKTAAGRCGEEAPFAVTALRSIGIPARGVVAPWWAHCDDNHAWVEAWCDGKWHFLGGCEPEHSLDMGWFKGSASRAMLIESRWFGKDRPREPVVEKPDMAMRLNHLGLYAKTVKLTIRVTDEEGNSIPGARVNFALLNYSRFNNIATLYTGAEQETPDYGSVTIETGYGDLLICAYENGRYGEKHISLTKRQEEKQGRTEDGREDTVVLRKEIRELREWRDMDFHAPENVPLDEHMTKEEEAVREKHQEEALRSRQQRIADFYRKEDCDRVLMRFEEDDRKTVEDILRQARGNMGEIVRFLEWDFSGQVKELEDQYGTEHWKVEALKALNPNDYWDIRAEVLAECSIYASPYAALYPGEIFFHDLLNPGTMFTLSDVCRGPLSEIFHEKQREEIRKNPDYLKEKLETFLISLPEQEYANLVTLPLGCLTGGICNDVSRMVLYLQIYRTLGIPARIRPVDRKLEYYMNGAYHLVSAEKAKETGTLILESGDSLKLEDWKHYSLSRFEDGYFRPLFIRPEKKGKDQPQGQKSQEKEEGTDCMEEYRLELECGFYRIVTTNRLQNGNQFVKIYDLCLEKGEERRVELRMRTISSEDLLQRMPVEDLALYTEDEQEVKLSSLSRGKKSLIIWLELTREPTEHILNEIYEKREVFQKLTSGIYFVLRKGINYRKDQTLMRTCGALPEAELLFEDFGEAYAALSVQVGRNPEKLPLAIVMEDGNNCIFSDFGYNVGMADMLLQILK